MSRRLLYALAAAVLLVAGVVAFGQNATSPTNPLRLISLLVSGDGTVRGDLSVNGTAAVGTRADVALLDAGRAIVQDTLNVNGTAVLSDVVCGPLTSSASGEFNGSVTVGLGNQQWMTMDTTDNKGIVSVSGGVPLHVPNPLLATESITTPHLDAGFTKSSTVMIPMSTPGNPTCSGGLDGPYTTHMVSQPASDTTSALFVCNGGAWLYTPTVGNECVGVPSASVAGEEPIVRLPPINGAQLQIQACVFTVQGPGQGAGNFIQYVVEHHQRDGGLVERLCEVTMPCDQPDRTAWPDLGYGCGADGGIPGPWSQSIPNDHYVDFSIADAGCSGVARPSGSFCCSYLVGLTTLPF